MTFKQNESIFDDFQMESFSHLMTWLLNELNGIILYIATIYDVKILIDR